MNDFEPIVRRVEGDGFAVCPVILSAQDICALREAMERIDVKASVRSAGRVFAVRNLLDASPEVQNVANSALIRALVQPVLGTSFLPVRAILFAKVPGANWKVPWHQDVTIAVQEKIECEGFGPWSMKADVICLGEYAFCAVASR